MTRDEMAAHINICRVTRVIKDPFPEWSERVASYEREYQQSRFFKPRPPAPPISIHDAYQQGYDKAYKEILECLRNAYGL